MFDEDDLLLLSALQHLAFCERQCALIHIEGLWDENLLTAEGRQLHDRAHDRGAETRDGVRTVRGLRLRSLRLGLAGKADVVEFHRCDDSDAAGCALEGVPGRWRPFPVEYKRGREKADDCDQVQLCAQALCLEEMLATSVPDGALFYGQTRRRTDVSVTAELRRRTEALAARLHELTRAGATPPAEYSKKCRSCSLNSLCLPKAAGRRGGAARYLESAIAEAIESGGDAT